MTAGVIKVSFSGFPVDMSESFENKFGKSKAEGMKGILTLTTETFGLDVSFHILTPTFLVHSDVPIRAAHRSGENSPVHRVQEAFRG